jgi:hypothetical protein
MPFEVILFQPLDTSLPGVEFVEAKDGGNFEAIHDHYIATVNHAGAFLLLKLEKIGCLLLKIFIHMNNGKTHLS